MTGPQEGDARWMALALRLAARGLGRTWPRPSVGCVLVRAGRVVGRGRTRDRWERPGHAEAVALAHAGAKAEGATAYVSLEPCAHHGQTPPCAEALAAAGVARVVSALEDPDARVAGRGHAILRAAGIAVETGCLAEPARALNLGFFRRVEEGRPMLTLKLATTLDGRIATASGESRWITGPGARAAVHRLRACHDAVMVGAGTARADDPLLDVRGLGMAHQPVRIVLDPALSLPLTGRLVRTAQDQPLWLLHRPDPNLAANLGPTLDPARLQALADAGVTLIETPAARDGTLDLAAALTHLAARGLTRILCEGGGRLAAALLAAERVDRLITHSAGALIGAEGVPAIAALGLPNLASAPRFALQSLAQTGSDITATWHPL